MKRYQIFLNLFIFLSCCSLNLSANGIGIVDGKTGVYLTVISSHVEVEVNNQIAITTTTQVFENRTGSNTIFKYGFPLNKGANPIGLRWKVGGFWYEAEVSTNKQDNDIPGQGGGGPGSGIDQDLLKYLGTQPLFFSPNDSLKNDSIIIMELKYVELLPYRLGKVNYYYKNDLSNIQDGIVIEQQFSFNLNAEREIVSIGIDDLASEDNINANSASIHFELFEQEANFDYNVAYELSSDGLGVFPLSTYVPDTIFNCDNYGNGFTSIIIEPESNVDTEVIEKNFTLIIDRSGSMSGDKIVQARAAASFIVNNLNFGDNFNIIDFSGNVKSLFEIHQPFSIDNQNLALNYIDHISAGGSTNISEALTISINQFQAIDPDKANIILFFTDGQATSGTTSTHSILEIVTDQINLSETSIFLFTFGIGSDVDKTLLTLLANQNNGLVQFVEEEHLEEDITEFFLNINNPVLINTSISFEPNNILEIYPNPLPNLYKGQQLIISGRYGLPQTVNMHLEGQAFNIPVTYDFEISLSNKNDLSKSFLPKIWAKQKIDALSLDFYLAEQQYQRDEIQTQIDSIGICYGVIAVDFTSFEDDTTTEFEILDISKSKFNIKVTPNPFIDFVQIQIDIKEPSFEGVNIELFDVHKRKILTKTTKMQGSQTIILLEDLGHLAKGIYFCKIRIENEIFIVKIIKV